MRPLALVLLLAGLPGAALPLTAQPDQAVADPEAVRQALVPFQELSQRLPTMLRGTAARPRPCLGRAVTGGTGAVA